MLCLIYRPCWYLLRNHRPSSCSEETSSEVQNASNFLITFHDIEGKNVAQKQEVTIQ